MIKHYLYCFLIAMVPLIELRGAVPIAVAFHEADASFNIPLAFVLIAVGNMVPVPFIFFFARRFLEWGRDKKVIGRFFTWCLEKGHKGGEKLQKSAEKAFTGLFSSSSEFRFPGPAPGPERWRHRFSTWTSKRVFSPLSAVWRLPASSWRFCPSAWQRACT